MPAGRTRTRLARLFGMPVGLLEQVRWFFLLFVLLVVAFTPLSLRRPSVEQWPDGAVAVGAFAILGFWAVWAFRTRGRHAWADPLPALLVAAGGWYLGGTDQIVVLYFVALCFHTLYGGRLRTATTVALYYVAFVGTRWITAGVPTLDLGTASVLVAFAATGLFVSVLQDICREQESVTARDAVLVAVGEDLLVAASRSDVVDAVLDAVAYLVPGNVGVSLWIGADVLELAGSRHHTGPEADEIPVALLPRWVREALTAGKPFVVDAETLRGADAEHRFASESSRTVVAPLLRDGAARGVLAVAYRSEDDLPTDHSALRRLAVETSLALDRVELTDELAHREELFRGLFESSPDLMILLDGEERVLLTNPTLVPLLRRWPDEVEGLSVLDLTHPEDRPRLRGAFALSDTGERPTVEARLRRDDGSWMPAELAIRRLVTGSARRVVNVRDLTERKRIAAEITFRAFHDPVTGIPNRALFNDRLAHALARLPRADQVVGLAVMDLDDFKAVNDNLGHAAGDELLATVGERLEEVVRGSDTAARLGGDEFGLLLEDLVDESEGLDVIDRVLGALRLPVELRERSIPVHASVGVAFAREGTYEAEALMRDADIALYAAKAKGKGRVEVFEPSMQAEALDRIQLRDALEDAIERGILGVHYQPIVDLRDDSVVAVEALVRWDDAERGAIPPSEFIPLAETSRLIIPLGAGMLTTACKQAVEWDHMGTAGGSLGLNVNLSPVQLHAPGLVEQVEGALEESGLEPERLVLEITETALVEDVVAAMRALESLKSLGVQIAVDDFGTGYSSLGYLNRFPVDLIKVDSEFVWRITEGPEEAAIAHAIVRLSRTLGIEPVAEGVEDGEQLQVLRTWGCRYAQGYLFAPPLPVELLEEWFRSRGDREQVPSGSES